MTDVRVDNPADFPPQETRSNDCGLPQRMTYVLRNSEDRPTKPKTKECPFCAGPKKSDEDGLIAWRGTHVFAIMNLYPYNVGHLMICPYRHVGFITELDDAELFEFEKATTLAMKVMETVSRPDGYNIGINQARSRVPESPRTCTSMWCRVGMAMRTSCPSSPRRVPCRFCCPTSETPMPRHSNSWPRSIICRLPDRVRHPRNRFYRYAQ